MKIGKKIRAKAALATVALREGVSLAQVEQSIQEAIDAAWADPAGRELQQQLFPKGKPSPSEFVAVTAAYLEGQEVESRAGEGYRRP